VVITAFWEIHPESPSSKLPLKAKFAIPTLPTPLSYKNRMLLLFYVHQIQPDTDNSSFMLPVSKDKGIQLILLQ
jgi:hypothetical protein